MMENEYAKKEILSTKQRLKDVEHALDKTKQSLEESWERSEQEKLTMEQTKNMELDTQRTMLEGLKESIAKQLQTKLKVQRIILQLICR